MKPNPNRPDWILCQALPQFDCVSWSKSLCPCCHQRCDCSSYIHALEHSLHQFSHLYQSHHTLLPLLKAAAKTDVIQVCKNFCGLLMKSIEMKDAVIFLLTEPTGTAMCLAAGRIL